MAPDSRGPSANARPERRARDRVLLAAALAIAAGVAFANLDAQILWQDEAQSALLARTVLEHGIPLGTDGRNFFSQELGAEYDDSYRWRWHTWLHFYLVAGSFALFGEGTAPARWPAALFGVLTVWGVHRLARSWWPGAPARAHASAASLLLLVPFWILARQCRYYSLTAFFSVAFLLGYARLTRDGGERPSRAGIAWLVVGGLGLFHSHYVYLPPLMAAVALHAALRHRARLRVLAAVCAGIVALCLPWIVWQSGMDYGRHYAGQLVTPGLWLANASWFSRSLLQHASGGAAIALLAVVATIGLRRVGPPRWRGAMRAVAADDGIGCLVIAALAIAATVSIVAPGPFFRYATPLLPLVALGFGALLGALARVHVLGAVAGLLAIAAFQPLGRFAGELRGGFEGPLEVLVAYLNANAGPEDTVWISYGDLPLKFYTRLRVVGGLTGEALEASAAAGPPDFVVLRHHVIHPDRDGRVAEEIRRAVDWREFRKIELPVTDTPFENREEPAEHRYRSARGGVPLVLYRRVRS